jgi:hypothetical protein
VGSLQLLDVGCRRSRHYAGKGGARLYLMIA